MRQRRVRQGRRKSKIVWCSWLLVTAVSQKSGKDQETTATEMENKEDRGWQDDQDSCTLSSPHGRNLERLHGGGGTCWRKKSGKVEEEGATAWAVLEATNGSKRKARKFPKISGDALAITVLRNEDADSKQSTGGPVGGQNAAASIQQREEGVARTVRANVTLWATSVRTAAVVVHAGSRTAPTRAGRRGDQRLPFLTCSCSILDPLPPKGLWLDHQELEFRSPSWASGFFFFFPSFCLSWQGRAHAPGRSCSERWTVWRCWQNTPEAWSISLPCSVSLPQHYCAHAFYLFKWKR